MPVFSKPVNLPILMVAPNGSRLTTNEHASVPVTIPSLVETAVDCFKCGAHAMHFHVRDSAQNHVLDAGLYKEALFELNIAVPNMHFQITSEVVGKYTPEDIRNLAYEVMPPGISIALTELIPDRNPKVQDIGLYQALYDSGVRIQHICFNPEDIDILNQILDAVNVNDQKIWCLFAIGHYTGRKSTPELIPKFVARLKKFGLKADWSICAFGKDEQECLKQAISMGGKVRVGFENSIWLSNGQVASSNSEKVRDVVQIIQNLKKFDKV